MQRVMLLNPKGGSGKTTLATSLASHYAATGLATVLVDHDAQGSSSRWLRVRPAAEPAIHGIEAWRSPAGVTRSFHMRIPGGTERVVVDTPAGFRPPQLLDLIRQADCVLVPVLPSHIDIDAVSAFLGELRRVEPVRCGTTRVAVVANRVRRRTAILRELDGFLHRAGFPFVAKLRDSQRYVRAAERGRGVLEGDPRQVRLDRMEWQPVLGWLGGEQEGSKAVPLRAPVAESPQEALFPVELRAAGTD